MSLTVEVLVAFSAIRIKVEDSHPFFAVNEYRDWLSRNPAA